MNDCEPAALFVDEEYQGLIEENKSKLPSVKTLYNLKADAGNFTAFKTLSDHNEEFKAEDSSVSADDGLVIIHTAAVEGRPRGALLSHGNILLSNMHLICLYGAVPQDVNLNLLPLFHIAGLMMATSTFHCGALNLNMSKFDAPKAVALIESQKVSVMFNFPPILSSLLEEAEKSGSDLHSFRAVLGLDSPATIEKYQKLSGGTFYCMYGQTETSCLATLGRYKDRPGSAGRTIELAEVRLMDEKQRFVAQGEIGEIVMKGPMVFKGYWNLPEDTEYTFRGGWHHTGDLGRFDEDGFLWYEGRKAEKELIKPGGENVYPAEVESAILEHDAVDKTVVFGVPDPIWKEGIKAVCTLKEGQELDSRGLIAFVSQRIASYKKPRYVEFVSELPLLKDGSPDRAKIKELYGGPQE